MTVMPSSDKMVLPSLSWTPLRSVEAERVGSPSTNSHVMSANILFSICATDGGVVLADDTIFPGVIGTGTSMLMGFLGVGFYISPALAMCLNKRFFLPCSLAVWSPLISTPVPPRSW